MDTVNLENYWYLILENNEDSKIIKYSKTPYELISLFRREIESKIYNPVDTWLYKNNPARITLTSIPIESLCLNPSQITLEILDYYAHDSAKSYCLAKIDSNNIITLLHNNLPTELIHESDIDIELCLLDIIKEKLDDIYKIWSDPDEHIYKLYDGTNIQPSWAQWFNTILSFDCLFYPPIEKMRTELINLAFRSTFVKYNHCYNKTISYFEL